MAMMLALARNVAQADASLRRGEWIRSKFMGVQLMGKTLGVIGFGRINGETVGIIVPGVEDVLALACGGVVLWLGYAVFHRLAPHFEDFV